MTVEELSVIITANTAGVQAEVDKAKTKIQSFSDSAGKAGDSMKKGFASVSKVVAGVAVGIGAALIAVGVKAVGFADGFNKALNGLQASTGATDKEMAGFKATMISLYNGGFGANFEEIGQAMATVRQQTGLSGKALEEMTKSAFVLKDTFGLEITDSVKAATQMTKNFGISGKEAMNLIAQGSQNGLNASGDLLDTLNEYSPTFAKQGFSATEMFNMISNGSKAGIKDTDLMADSIKEFGIRSKDGSKTTIDAFKSLGLNSDALTKSFGKGGAEGKKAFSEVAEKLKGIKDPVEQNRIGVELFGTQFEDAGAKGILAMMNTKGAVDGTKDAINGINKIKYNTFGEGLAGIGRIIQTSVLLPIGDKLIPKLQEMSQYIIDNMPQIKAIVAAAMSGVGTAFDIVIKVIGTVVNGFINFRAVLIPIMAVVAAVIVNAWVVTTATAVSSAITQGIAQIKTEVAWIKSAGTATINALKQVAAWVMVGLGAIKSAAITVAQSIVVVAKWVLMGIQAMLNAAKVVLGWVITGIAAIAAVVIMVAQSAIMVAKWAFMGAQALIHAAKMAAAWVIALGPIGWAIIAIVAIAAIVIANWAKIKAVTIAVFTAVGSWIKSKWTEIKSAITGAVNGIKSTITSVWNSIKSTTSSVFNGVKSVITSVWNGIKSTVSSAVNGIKSTITSVWNAIRSTTSSVFNGVKNAIMSPINSAVSLVGRAVSRIKGFFSGLHFSFPAIKLPRLPTPHIRGSFSLTPPSVPHLSWYQNGGVFNKASMIGVGENGAEAVMPLERNTGWITDLANKVSNRMPAGGNNGLQGASDSPMTIVMQVGSSEIGRVVIDSINKLQRQTGRILLDL